MVVPHKVAQFVPHKKVLLGVEAGGEVWHKPALALPNGFGGVFPTEKHLPNRGKMLSNSNGFEVGR